jgi:hypothetical protein
MKFQHKLLIFSDCWGTLTPPIGIGKKLCKEHFYGKSILCVQKEANTIDLFARNVERTNMT